MLGGIKNFFEWPEKGVSNIKELGDWLSGKWLTLLILLIGALVVIWVVKKILGFLFGIFRE